MIKRVMMLDSFFKSDFFEKKFYFLRKNIGFFNKQYMRVHQLAKGYEDKSASMKSQASLLKIKEAANTPHNSKRKSNKIWIYWNSPLPEAPEIVRLSVQSWINFNPEYEVIVLNDEVLESKLGFDFNAIFEIFNIRLTLANKADLLRLYLLSRYGGIWADATTFCVKPLSIWLPGIASENEFFTFRQNKVRSRPIEVWFIYADQGSPIIKRTLDMFIDYLSRERINAIYVSNSKKKMRKLGIEKNHPYKLYSKVVYDAERFGFMPYFSLAYFFNESMYELLSEDENNKFFELSNNFSNNEDELSTFASSYVSKQTYKDEYQSSTQYSERKRLLLQSSTIEI